MRIISSIEDQEIIKTILNHLGLWLIRSRSPAKAHAPPSRQYIVEGSSHAVSPNNTPYGDPDYLWDAYITP
jgi:hypothetical protein